MSNVVQFPVQSSLRLRDIIGTSGKGVIGSWIAAHPGARARLRIRVQHLRRIPRTEWTKKQFRPLGDGLFEIKWEWNNVQFRIAGFDHNGFFVMVVGYTHKQKVYDPRNWLETAKRRKGEVKYDKWRTVEFEP